MKQLDDIYDCLNGGGEVGARLRAIDWASHPLGPVSTWSASLKATVRIILNSYYPMFVWWGKQRINIYNDAYTPILGKRHPAALANDAAETWSDIWDDVGPLADNVMRTGQASFHDQMLLIMHRNGFPEETYFTFSYSPAPADSGGVGGVFCACTEETPRVVSERRLRLLKDLSEASTEVTTVAAACGRAAETLGRHARDVSFAMIYMADADSNVVRLAATAGIVADADLVPDSVPLDTPATAWPFAVALGDAPRVLTDLSDFGLPGGDWPESTDTVFVAPLRVRSGYIAGYLIAGASPRLLWDNEYRRYMELLADSIARAVGYAAAHEAERAKSQALAELNEAKTAFLEKSEARAREAEQANATLQTAQRALLESEARFRNMADNSPVMIWITEPSGECSFLNNTWYRFTGQDPHAGQGYGWVDAVHPDDRERSHQAFLNATAGQTHFRVEYRLRRHDGVYRWAIDSAAPRRGRQGEFLGFIGSVLDITDRKTMEEDRQRFVSLAENSTDFVGMCDLNFQPFFINEAGRRLIGLDTEEEALSHPVGRHFFPEDRPFLQDVFLRRVLQDGHAETEIRFRHFKTGAAIWTQYHVFVLKGSAGEIVGYGTVSRDITEQRQIETRRQFLLQLNEAVRPLTDAQEIMLTVARMLGQVLNGDRCAYAVVDADEDSFEVVGDYCQGVPSMVGRFRFSAFGDEVLQHLQAGKALVINDCDTRQPSFDDFTAFRQTQIRAALSAPLQKGGKLVAVMAVHSATPRTWTPDEIELVLVVANRCWDAIERGRVTRELQESEAKFRQLANSAPMIIWQANPEGSLEYYNDRWYEFTGFDRERIGDQSWEPILHPDDVAKTYRVWYEAVRTGGMYNIEYRFLDRRTGDYRWFLGRALPVRDASGAVIRWFGSCTDIDAQKRAEAEREQLLESERSARAEAERAGRMKDEFLATLSHELRTPLNAILGYATLIRIANMTGDDLDQATATIERNAKLQATLIEDLLDMNRIVSGKLRIEVQTVNVDEVIEAAIGAVRPSADARGVRLQTLIDPQAGPIRGDPARVQQIVWNLLSNAIKFTPRNGRVQIKLQRIDSQIEIAVSDTGQGIAPGFLPYVFDRFRQADASSTRRHGGLGLGLAIVRQLVELHGGTVTAESEGENQGSTFRVRLPIAAMISQEEQPITGALPPAPRTAIADISVRLDQLSVLVVDDEPDATALVQRVLSGCGASVAKAGSVDEALTQLSRASFDVLVSDIGMPGADGYDLIRALRSQTGQNRNIPAVALTAFARSEDRTRAALAGFQSHLAKPVEAGELIAVVANLAGRTGNQN